MGKVQSWEIEKLLNEDAMEKRRAGRGSFHNSGRRGGGTRGVKGVRTPVDVLVGKAKKEYTKGGQVMTTSIYDDIKNVPNFDQMLSMDFEKAKNIAMYIRGKFTNKVLIDHWNVSTGRMYDRIFYHFNIVQKPDKKEKINKYQININKIKNNKTRSETAMVNQVEGYIPLEDIISVKQIENMPYDQAKAYIEKIKIMHSVSKLRKHWGLSQYMIYNKLFPKYNIELSEVKGGRITKKEDEIISQTRIKEIEVIQKDIQAVNEDEIIKQDPVVLPSNLPTVTLPVVIPKLSFKISLEGKIAGAELSDKLTSISSIVREKSNYKILLSMTEISEGNLFTIDFNGQYTEIEIKGTISNLTPIINITKDYNVKFMLEEINED